jgi:hypothetical protein
MIKIILDQNEWPKKEIDKNLCLTVSMNPVVQRDALHDAQFPQRNSQPRVKFIIGVE